MHSKERYKICAYLVILGELESFRNYKGFSIILLKILDAIIITYYESENFSDSSLHHIFESENVRFPFCTKNSLTWAVKSKELNFRKS